MKTLFIILTVIVVIIGFVLFMYKRSRYTEHEDNIYLTAWRKGLQRNDLVRVGGMVYRIEAFHPNGVIELFRYSNGNKFVTLDEVWPVD